jgi:hypothetical protein
MEDVTQPKITTSYEVDVQRFDERFRRFDRPALCKIDVEGGELSVLEGMSGAIQNIDVVVVETAMNSLFKGGHELSDVIAYFKTVGFSMYDFVGLARRPYDRALIQIDAVFVPTTSSLRVKRWE